MSGRTESRSPLSISDTISFETNPVKKADSKNQIHLNLDRIERKDIAQRKAANQLRGERAIHILNAIEDTTLKLIALVQKKVENFLKEYCPKLAESSELFLAISNAIKIFISVIKTLTELTVKIINMILSNPETKEQEVKNSDIPSDETGVNESTISEDSFIEITDDTEKPQSETETEKKERAEQREAHHLRGQKAKDILNVLKNPLSKISSIGDTKIKEILSKNLHISEKIANLIAKLAVIVPQVLVFLIEITEILIDFVVDVIDISLSDKEDLEIRDKKKKEEEEAAKAKSQDVKNQEDSKTTKENTDDKKSSDVAEKNSETQKDEDETKSPTNQKSQ
ncbi:MAG: hypothetical protein K2L13_01680 [Opitutales bacterium]|nr:hypothetical protein [Opitutales bacterium]